MPGANSLCLYVSLCLHVIPCLVTYRHAPNVEQDVRCGTGEAKQNPYMTSFDTAQFWMHRLADPCAQKYHPGFEIAIRRTLVMCNHTVSVERVSTPSQLAEVTVPRCSHDCLALIPCCAAPEAGSQRSNDA